MTYSLVASHSAKNNDHHQSRVSRGEDGHEGIRFCSWCLRNCPDFQDCVVPRNTHLAKRRSRRIAPMKSTTRRKRTRMCTWTRSSLMNSTWPRCMKRRWISGRYQNDAPIALKCCGRPRALSSTSSCCGKEEISGDGRSPCVTMTCDHAQTQEVDNMDQVQEYTGIIDMTLWSQ